MVFTVTDFADLTRLLAEHPEWQAELRRLILSEDFLALPAIVRELAEAQQRTEQQVSRLEQAMERLAEAQQRTEQRMEELAEAQRRTEQQVERLGIAAGQLQAAFGSTIEEEAESFFRDLLESKGYRLLSEPYSVALDGEVDVVMEVEDPAGEKVWAVLEAKARQGHRQVWNWAQRMKSAGWQQRLAEKGVTGPYLVYAYGIRIDPGAVHAAEQQGIGLLTGRGERVSPKGLIRPS
jgi:Holliday junction resolvase-like predicted endonuclease